MINLGYFYEDKVTGFKGCCTGYVQYLTGCNQALLVPRAADDGTTHRDSQWFDVQRLQPLGNEPVVLNNGATPGADKAAPKR